MVLDACFCHSYCQNFYTILGNYDPRNGLLGASTESSSFITHTSWTFLPISNLSSALVILFADNNLFSLFMKAYLVAQTIALTAVLGLALSPNTSF